MPTLVLDEENFILLSILLETIARDSLRQILLGQSVVCCARLCRTSMGVILHDLWSYGSADHGQSVV